MHQLIGSEPTSNCPFHHSIVPTDWIKKSSFCTSYHAKTAYYRKKFLYIKTVSTLFFIIQVSPFLLSLLCSKLSNLLQTYPPMPLSIMLFFVQSNQSSYFVYSFNLLQGKKLRSLVLKLNK